jgi:AcrR family transcriptional regulator
MDNREKILTAFRDHVGRHGHAPASVLALCEPLGLLERDFYTEFGSLDALESAFWEDLFAKTLAAVASGPEWEGFGAKQRLLTLLFAFLEKSLDVRTVLLFRFKNLPPVSNPDWLRGMERRFKEWAAELVRHAIASGEIAERGRLGGLYPQALYLHFRAVIDFYVKDTSPRYERTDAFVEKTVTLAFDLLRTQAIDSAFDLLRFLAPRFAGRS